jgi:hypothetical protein
MKTPFSEELRNEVAEDSCKFSDSMADGNLGA